MSKKIIGVTVGTPISPEELKKKIRGIVDITISEITDEDENTGNDSGNEGGNDSGESGENTGGDTGGGSDEITGGYTLVLHDYNKNDYADTSDEFTSEPIITFADGHKETMQLPAVEESITYNNVTKVEFYAAVDGALIEGTGDFDWLSVDPNTPFEVTLTQDSTIYNISK
jgi:hypothetical protein